ncbi:type I-C CRISPR-associated protein Cas8c/Csd1 [Zhongshania sp.]|uniref:type I-C CRISPR-associated protein Cas8c/Csd1 n=1 Tax=Zhongshania sp. TaxID=1971902 RepID=UPI0035678D4E
MSWMARLYDTYEQAMQLDVAEDLKPIPICHTVQNTHLNIVIDGHGNFKRAKVLEKTQIVLPATENSAGRGAGEAPHALADKLQYLAGDYASHGGLKKAYFDGFRAQLTDWCNSEFSNPSACAVLAYVSKGVVISDLTKAQITCVDDAGQLLTSWPDRAGEAPLLFKVLPKEAGKLDQGNALVCWTVEADDIECPETWKDTELQRQWIAFDSGNSDLAALCFVSGSIQPIALSHPAKLRHSGDKAKLISSNDMSGFTFKGRFTDNDKSIKQMGLQSAAIGSVTSQKAHNALRWLINRPRQSFRNGDQVIVAWAVSGKEIPDPMVATADYDFDNYDKVEPLPSGESAIDADVDHTIDLGQSYAAKLSRFMNGYRADLAVNDCISIMAIDSATPGRMGVVYYRETLPQEYIDTLSQWHTDFAWPQRMVSEVSETGGKPKAKTKSKVTWRCSAPSPYTILNAVYGDIIKGNDSLKKNFYQRIIPCILEGRSIPIDLVQRSVQQASNPSGQEHWAWEKSLGVACSLYRGYYLRHPRTEQQKEFAMALDTTITSRDYLYGRLLALAERLEEVALRAASVNRPTTANRLMQRFSSRPYETWLTIYKQLDPYMRQMKTSRPGFFININKEIDAVMAMFDREEFVDGKALSGEFLLGFHCQRLALNHKPETQIETTATTTEE